MEQVIVILARLQIGSARNRLFHRIHQRLKLPYLLFRDLGGRKRRHLHLHDIAEFQNIIHLAVF